MASAAATAAAATTTTSGDVATVEIDVEQDQSRWALPLDSYLIADPHAVAYGEQLAVQPCLEEAGYAWPVPWQDLTEERFEWMNDAGRTLFNAELAARSGYHRPITTSPSIQAWDEFGVYVNSFNADDAFNAVFDTCLDAVRAENPMPNMDDQMYVYGLITESKQIALSSPALSDAAKRWNSCLQEAGIDAPATPEMMPTDQMKATFGLDGSEAQRAAGATPDEIKLATQDAECAASSRYDEIFYKTQWDSQVVLIDNNAPKLSQIKADVDRYARGIQTFIDAYAPSGPQG
ncbi:MAG TPA: hypothetical protein DEB57_07390 [Microbacterium sp.]|nr:hypothetical protein [Microbacterium sp.]